MFISWFFVVNNVDDDLLTDSSSFLSVKTCRAMWRAMVQWYDSTFISIYETREMSVVCVSMVDMQKSMSNEENTPACGIPSLIFLYFDFVLRNITYVCLSSEPLL